MSRIQNSRCKGFSLILILSLVFFMLSEERAEARGRRGSLLRRAFFGREFKPASKRKGARCCSRANRLGRDKQKFNRFDDFDRLALARQAVDPFSSLALDPTGDISRLGGLEGLRELQRIGTSNIAVNERGEFFEQLNSDSLSTDRPLIFNDGKILGGSVVPLRDDTLEQVRLLNASNSLRFLGRR